MNPFDLPARAAVSLAERGVVPDPLLHAGIRAIVDARLREERRLGPAGRAEATRAFVGAAERSPIAIDTAAANAQHYEVSPRFFELVLGPRRKYSGCLWSRGVRDLAGAEERMLELTCARARIEDGMRVLDLGCGWGSLSLWIAERYPNCSVLGVSNSASQRASILERAPGSVEVVTADVNDFDPGERFDRVVSIEMFEHLRNWRAMLARVAAWLHDDGRAFLHVFAHEGIPYAYEERGAGDWMARTFFTGGIMPSTDLLLHFQDDLRVERSWLVDGRHYARTAEAWLANLDAAREGVLGVLQDSGEPELWLHRWRLFFLACSGLFGHRSGAWPVQHALLAPR